MKTLKRVLTVAVLIIVLALLIGYLVYTGGQVRA